MLIIGWRTDYNILVVFWIQEGLWSRPRSLRYVTLYYRCLYQWPFFHIYVETPGPALNVRQIYIYFFLFSRKQKTGKMIASDLWQTFSHVELHLQLKEHLMACPLVTWKKKKKAQRQVYHRPFVGKYFAKIYYKNINVSTTNHFTLVDKAIYICTHELSHRHASQSETEGSG